MVSGTFVYQQTIIVIFSVAIQVLIDVVSYINFLNQSGPTEIKVGKFIMGNNHRKCMCNWPRSFQVCISNFIINTMLKQNKRCIHISYSIHNYSIQIIACQVRIWCVFCHIHVNICIVIKFRNEQRKVSLVHRNSRVLYTMDVNIIQSFLFGVFHAYILKCTKI